jgi:light-harvesting complex I chlorophyll a/b binding protein 1
MIAVLGEMMAQVVSGEGTYEQLGLIAGDVADFTGVSLPF